MDDGAGIDLLHGGASHDVYDIDRSAGNDTIIDTDGGLVMYQGQHLTDGEATSPGAQEWKDKHATYRIVTEGSQEHLLIRVGAGTVTIRDWTPGHFGMQLEGYEAPTPGGASSRLCVDLAPVGEPCSCDQLGNVIFKLGQPAPNRADTFLGGAGNDQMACCSNDAFFKETA